MGWEIWFQEWRSLPRVKESEIGKEKYEEALKNFRFDEALAVIWSKLSELDKYVNENKPWEKQGGALDKDLQYLISSILSLNFLLEPFLPETAEKIKKQFSGKISPAAPLFPRLR